MDATNFKIGTDTINFADKEIDALKTQGNANKFLKIKDDGSGVGVGQAGFIEVSNYDSTTKILTLNYLGTGEITYDPTAKVLIID